MFRLTVFASCLVLALAYPSESGVPRLDGRIVGGDPAYIEDYPYQISLMYYGSHICGGSILNANHVVTAAHCTDGQSAGALSIRAGSTYEGNGGQVLKVSEIHQNPAFSFAGLDSDVSVLKLSGNLNFGSGVQPIALAGQEPAPNKNAVCTGWGALSSGGGSPSQLQSVTVQIINRSDCRGMYGESKITDNMICAGASGKDSCQGDSGGPLAVDGSLAGIVSWGYGCADPQHPGVYSNVAVLSSYINRYSNA